MRDCARASCLAWVLRRGADGRVRPQSRSLLNDFAEITCLDTGDADNSPENQSALIEIEERKWSTADPRRSG